VENFRVTERAKTNNLTEEVSSRFYELFSASASVAVGPSRGGSSHRFCSCSWRVMLLAGIGPGMLRAQGKKLGRDLMDMSLGDLMSVKVTSAF